MSYEKLQRTEWEKWLEVCKILRKYGIEINHADDLNEALIEWGRALVELRKFDGR